MANESKKSPAFKTVIASVCATGIIAFGAFTFKNVQFPRHKTNEDALDSKIKEVNESEKEKTLQFELLRQNVNSNTIKMDNVVKKIEELNEGQKELLRWIIDNNRKLRNDDLTRN